MESLEKKKAKLEDLVGVLEKRIGSKNAEELAEVKNFLLKEREDLITVMAAPGISAFEDFVANLFRIKP